MFIPLATPLHLSFLHGFLGCPQDWEQLISFLPEFKCQALSYPFEIPENSIPIGYSMGGRIALSHPGPKILLSAHPGLLSLEERKKREEEEDLWISQLKALPLQSFLEKWYHQPLFDTLRAHPLFSSLMKRRERQDKSILLNQLQKHRLSNQRQHSLANTFFLYGEKDTKYANLLSSYPHSYKVENSGHACHLENPQKCAEIIQTILLHSLSSLR